MGCKLCISQSLGRLFFLMPIWSFWHTENVFQIFGKTTHPIGFFFFIFHACIFQSLLQIIVIYIRFYFASIWHQMAFRAFVCWKPCYCREQNSGVWMDLFPFKGNLLNKCYKTWCSLLLHHDKLFLYKPSPWRNKCHDYIYASH